jgi:hypothetical protein
VSKLSQRAEKWVNGSPKEKNGGKARGRSGKPLVGIKDAFEGGNGGSWAINGLMVEKM